jgi:hypothetical protein
MITILLVGAGLALTAGLILYAPLCVSGEQADLEERDQGARRS